ncbi:MAG: lipoprotein signal peptidase [Paludibacteraceae bacterium]|jgi:signal peptidase II|nr:lipoprotein signal peptidase [Prevotellaceae bacterium]
MTKEIRNGIIKASSIALGIILVDQIFKVWIKTHFALGESFRITDWFYIAFVENNGMAFGLEFFDKIFLTIFRIIAVGALGYYLYHIIKRGYRFGYIAAISMIFAGALGNIIDCMFYGLWFDKSIGNVANFLPDGGGYAPFMYGKVVDMLYFPLIDTTWPSWMPFVGGKSFTFFDPVFNIADSAICIGVFVILLFQRDYIIGSSNEKESHENINEENKFGKNGNDQE